MHICPDLVRIKNIKRYLKERQLGVSIESLHMWKVLLHVGHHSGHNLVSGRRSDSTKNQILDKFCSRMTKNMSPLLVEDFVSCVAIKADLL